MKIPEGFRKVVAGRNIPGNRYENDSGDVIRTIPLTWARGSRDNSLYGRVLNGIDGVNGDTYKFSIAMSREGTKIPKKARVDDYYLIISDADVEFG